MSGRRLLAIVLLSIGLGVSALFFLSSEGEGPSRGWFGRLTMALTSPLQNAVSKVSDGIEAVWNDYYMLLGVREARDRLIEEKHRLLNEIKRLKESAKRAERLERLLKFTRRHPGKYLGAQVIALSSDPLVRTVRIDKGRDQGVRNNRPVLSADGVVGRILNATDDWSDVLLLTDVSSSIAVLIGEARARGIIVGRGTDDADCEVKFLRRGNEVKVGDMAITSGLDGIFPKGLPVGTVSNVSDIGRGLFLEASIKPAADLMHLEEVLVLSDGGLSQ